jgi:hypothetical protein
LFVGRFDATILAGGTWPTYQTKREAIRLGESPKRMLTGTIDEEQANALADGFEVLRHT